MSSDDVARPADDDLIWLQEAEDVAEELLREHYGDVVLMRDVADLELAQRLVADGHVGPEDVLHLQCLGVVLGNVFEARTGLRWARVKNEFGDMLALHSSAAGFTLYPLTMISKRMAQEREVDIPGLFRSFVADLKL